MKYLLDTHAWIWWNMNPKKLSRRIQSLIAAPAKYEELLLSAISPWEFAKLLEKRRLAVACDSEEWVRRAMDMPKMRLVPLTAEIACRSAMLPPPFHDDPADQIIAATARQESATIVTADKRIRSYQHVKSIW